MVDVTSFIEGPLLWITMLIFVGGVAARLSFFFISIARASMSRETPGTYIASTLGRFLAPLHMLLTRRPGYASLRLLFHLLMVAIPVWLSSHIIIWEISRFEWTWPALPWWLADLCTVLFLAILIFFIVRRATVLEIRRVSSSSDYLLLAITGLPFLTGLLSTHGLLESFPFFGDNMQVLHELSGEIMLIAAAVLFCRPRINEEKCVGCAACELSCPTGTIEASDAGIYRIFQYSHYQCICCGNCVKTCPEYAADLRHEISGRRFVQISLKYEIRSVELKECQQCGARFAPEPQMDKIRNLPAFAKVQSAIDERQVRLCPQCRTSNHADVLYRVAAKPKMLKKTAAVRQRTASQR